MNLIERMSAPTPTFFKRLRNAGLVLTAVSGTIITSPVSLPAAVVQQDMLQLQVQWPVR